MAEEMRQHLEHLVASNIAAGMDAESARYAASRAFGGIEQIKEQSRDHWKPAWLDNLQRDLSYAFRQLRRAPVFSFTILCTLALGIGFTTAFYSVARGILLLPLGYPASQELVVLSDSGPAALPSRLWVAESRPDVPPAPLRAISSAAFLYWRDHATSFREMAARGALMVNLRTANGIHRLTLDCVTVNFLTLHGVSPLLGRGFAPGDRGAGPDAVAILSHETWQAFFHGDANIVGQTCTIDQKPVRIIGVLPPQPFPELPVTLMVPVEFTDNDSTNFRVDRFLVTARLKPGVTPEDAWQEMAGLVATTAKQGETDVTHASPAVIPLSRFLTGELRRPFLTLLGAVACVLVIACVTTANLLRARTHCRAREWAIRSAVGAHPGQLVRQVFCESAVISLVAGGFGVALAWLVVHFLLRLQPLGGAVLGLPRVSAVELDLHVLGAAFVLSSIVGLVCGLWPALSRFRTPLPKGEAIHRGVPGKGSLVAAVSLATTLLATACLLARHVSQLAYRVDDRMPPVYMMAVSKTHGETADGSHLVAFGRDAVSAVSQASGVRSCAIAARWEIPVQSQLPGFFSVSLTAISADFFSTVGGYLDAGRLLEAGDDHAATAPVVIDTAAARHFFPGINPLGQTLRLTRDIGEFKVVGVVHGVDDGLRVGRAGQIFISFRQRPSNDFRVYIQSTADREALASVCRNAIETIPGGAGAGYFSLRGEWYVRRLQPLSDLMLVFLAFAGAALGITAASLYGSIAYTVERRLQEIGVRIAVGAQFWDLVNLVLVRDLKFIGGSIVLGLGLALLACRYSGTLPLGDYPYDFLILIFASVIVMGIATAACLLPLRSAFRVDIVSVLRSE